MHDGQCLVRKSRVHSSGFSCKDMSKMHKDRGGAGRNCLANQTGTSGNTLAGLVSYCKSHRPEIVVLMNFERVSFIRFVCIRSIQFSIWVSVGLDTLAASSALASSSSNVVREQESRRRGPASQAPLQAEASRLEGGRAPRDEATREPEIVGGALPKWYGLPSRKMPISASRH